MSTGGGDAAPPAAQAASPGAARPAHRRAAAASDQRAWIVFGGEADQPWLRPLRRGFRHCFAALRDAAGGWTVLDPLTGRLVVARLDLPEGFDLPGFYRRAGLAVLGPFEPGEPCRRWLPPLAPFSCVGLCRAVLGADAPRAFTPFGLYRGLQRRQAGVRPASLPVHLGDEMSRNFFLTGRRPSR